MVKVRESNIPEDSPVVKKIPRAKKSAPKDDFFLSDEDFPDEEEKTYFRTMLNFPDKGVMINVYAIQSIEKIFRLVESNYGSENITPKYGIAINKGVTPSPSFPKTDIELWYEKEEIRDQSFKKMMSVLDDAGIKILTV